MSFLQLVLSLDKTKEEIILLWRICQFDRYHNILHPHKFLNGCESPIPTVSIFHLLLVCLMGVEPFDTNI